MTPTNATSRIRVTSRGFHTGDDVPFVPFGVNYYRPGTGWAPKVWRQFDPDATRDDFARLRALGANCVRVFLTFDSFCPEMGQIDPVGLGKFEQFLDLADEAGLYVHPTGPDHWEGLPVWITQTCGGDRYADETFLQALEAFWHDFAARFADRPTIFAYDLLNEPSVPWDTPALQALWGGPPPEPVPGAPGLLAHQHLREQVATTWTRRQVDAIRAVSPQTPITVGLIQWSVPAMLPSVRAYAAYRPAHIAPLLDFLEIHFYPLAPFLTYEPGQVDSNLLYLETLLREVIGFCKPVVIAEFGWYGGGSFSAHPPASEEDQAAWCSTLVEHTAGLACGWLNWGFRDQPEARDVSVLTGLLTPQGDLKAWGRRFAELASTVAAAHCGAKSLPEEPRLDWDACITDPEAGEAFRIAYAERRP